MSIKFYVISCSSGAELPVSELYVWGEMPPACWLPQSPKEARRVVTHCRLRKDCPYCDAEIHEVVIPERKKTTYKQSLSADKTEKTDD